MTVFLAPSNFGALWCKTWQLCSENNLNDLGDIKYTNFVKIWVNASTNIMLESIAITVFSMYVVPVGVLRLYIWVWLVSLVCIIKLFPMLVLIKPFV